jgi:hypothetical protein
MDRAAKTREVIEDCIRRRGAGEVLPDEEVIRRHPGLMPELAAELKKLRWAQQPTSDYSGPLPDGQPSCATPSTPPDVPDYRLLHRIGEGGFGSVWLGESLLVKGRRCAVKVVPRSNAADLDGVREYQGLAEKHRNLVPIHHVGEAPHHSYYVMPLADDPKGPPAHGVRPPGEYEALTLEWYTRRRMPLPVDDIRTIAEPVLSALECVHNAGKYHCDVKPGNVLRVGGAWCLGDFGLMISRAEDPSGRGTRQFWSPEGPDDLYALGKTLYLLLTGAGLEGFEEFAAGRVKAPGDDPRAEGLRDIILRACHKDPSRRFARPEDMRQAITALAGGRRRKPWFAHGAVAFAALALLGGVAALLVSLFTTRPSANPPGPDGRGGGAGPGPLTGWMDVRVWKQGDLDRPGLRLHQAGALPLRKGDHLRIEAGLNRKAYLYVVQLLASGEVVPQYPWRDYRWGNRPPERPQQQWSLPDTEGAGVPLDEGPSGVESILLLAREERLPAGEDEKLAGLFAGLPKQGRLGGPRLAAWFRNGELVTDEDDRGPIRLEKEREVGDTVMRVQVLLRGKLRPLFPYTRAVCYGFQGR